MYKIKHYFLNCYHTRHYMRHHARRGPTKGFTLIEIIIYCAIFMTFAVSVIESMIWINSKMSLQEKLSEIRNHNVYKINFANTYKRYKLNNPKIENQFQELIASTSTTSPQIQEDKDLGIILNQTAQKTGAEKEKFKVTFFDSIDI